MGYNNAMTNSMLAYSADAFKNMYDIQIKWPISSSTGNADEIVSVRAKGIKIPDFGTATYEKSYHGNKASFPKPEQEFERSIDITFTVDAAWIYYKKFCWWMSAVADAVNGGVSNWPTLLGNVYVGAKAGAFLPLDATDKVKGTDYSTADDDTSDPAYVQGTAGDFSTASEKAGALSLDASNDLFWAFKDCWVSKVTAPDFAVDSADALEFTVTFKFFDYDAPYYGGIRTSQKSTEAPNMLFKSSSGGGDAS